MYNFIFIILVFRNMDDLCELIDSIAENVLDYKIVIVNSFYDDKSMNKAMQISRKYGCDFINVENKGYSYGNNVGIEYACTHYNFDYLIISNPDIVLKQFCLLPNELEGDIIAPKIIAAKGKLQNPMVIKRSRFSEWLVYKGFKSNRKTLLYAGICLNRISRRFNLYLRKNKCRFDIYCAHGSFLLLSHNAIDQIGMRPYDENMFLFAEEAVLAKKAKSANLSVVYDGRIIVNHKEDGSMKLSDISVNTELSKSNIYYYEKYCKGENNVY